MINEQIRDKEVRVIGVNGEMIGVMSSKEAYKLAQEAELDLIKIAPTAQPPVCKIADYGKYKYEQIRREKEARKKQKTVEIKEVRLSPNIESNDLNTKVNAARKFLEKGDKVKVTLRFRGRDLAHMSSNKHILDDLNTSERLPEILKNNDRPLDTLKGVIDTAIQKVIANYKLAVPHYYQNKIQLLVPLCFTKEDNKPDVALVLDLMKNGYYQATTCLTMDMAYMDARLIAKPDSDWLCADNIIEENTNNKTE